MTRQLTIPPAHVWDKIEKILDEQDKRKYSEEFFDTSGRPAITKRTGFLWVSVTGLISVLLIVLNYTLNLKSN